MSEREQAKFQEIISDALARLEELGLYGAVFASVSPLDRPGYCWGKASNEIGTAAQVMHLGFIHVSAHQEMADLHPAALLEATQSAGRA